MRASCAGVGLEGGTPEGRLRQGRRNWGVPGIPKGSGYVRSLAYSSFVRKSTKSSNQEPNM